jgi:Flp pilus assembly pilin Flp
MGSATMAGRRDRATASRKGKVLQSMSASYGFIRAWIHSRRRGLGDRGASLLEYAVIVVLIAVVCMATVALLTRSSTGKTSPITTSTSQP